MVERRFYLKMIAHLLGVDQVDWDGGGKRKKGGQEGPVPKLREVYGC